MTQKHPGAYIVMDAYGNPWGPFEKASEAAIWATKKWPDQKESAGDEHGHPSDGWSVWALRHPDT